MSDNFQPPALFTPTTEVPGEQERRLQNSSSSFTANAVDTTTDNTKPGVLPGGYPAVDVDSETPLNYPPASAVSGIAQSAYQTAQGALQSVGSTVKPYLPESIASYLPGTTTTTSLQSQQSVQTRAPQDAGLTAGVTSSLPGIPTSDKSEAYSTTNSPSSTLTSHAQSAGQTIKSTTASAANTISTQAGNAATTVHQSVAGVANTVVGMAPESVAQYLPNNRDTQQTPNTIPTGPGHHNVASTDIAATTTISPLNKPTNANTHTATIAGSSDIAPLNKPSSLNTIDPLFGHSNDVDRYQDHTGSTAVAPKKSTAITPARVDLDSRPSQVAMTTLIAPLNKQEEHVVENTEVAGATSIAPLEKGGNGNGGMMSSATSGAVHAAQAKTAEVTHQVHTAAAHVLPSRSTSTTTTSHDDSDHHNSNPLRSRSPIMGDQTAHPKATTGDNVHAPATTTITSSARGLPRKTVVMHTKDDPAHEVLARHEAAAASGGGGDARVGGGGDARVGGGDARVGGGGDARVGGGDARAARGDARAARGDDVDGDGNGDVNVDGEGDKPSMKDRMKGEIKVLAGKIGRNEEKVEEGKRMMGKSQN